MPDGRLIVFTNSEEYCSKVAMEVNLIESNPAVMMGKRVIKGTRITVELILEKLAADESVEQVLDAPPRLTREAVLKVRDICDGKMFMI